MTILKTIELTRVYNKNYYIINALTDCNLEIDQGEFIAITGARGSGKSTLINLLGGKDSPNHGKVYFENQDITSMNQTELARICRREIGTVFQDLKLLMELTVRDNIILPALLDGHKYDKELFAEVVQCLDLKDILHNSLKSLSEEQRQSIALARALINKPRVILADEPTNRMNSDMGFRALDLLMQSARTFHQTLVMITINPKEYIFADRMVRMESGKIAEDRRL